ncbi:hypothetical protein MMC12_000416 [Toensbergia leucococca]|nr:hypothetical protein [Toensbergia leucococca]
MSRRLLTRVAHTHTSLIFLGSCVVVGVHNKKSQLRSDSGSNTQWPRTQAIIAEKRLSGNSHQHSTANLDGTTTPPPKEAAQPQHEKDENEEEEEEDRDESMAWASFSSRFAIFHSSIAALQWSSIADLITNHIIPDWAKLLPDYILKLQREMEMGPGSLAEEIWDEAHDVDINPEIVWNANVRIGTELCAEEQEFKKRRKHYTTQALAQYLGVPEEEVHPDDVPTIAMCGSGGGLRALVAGTGSYLSAQEAGLFDCITYTAGVSGSCWLQTLYYSSLAGRRHNKLVEHLKKRIGVHIAFPPTALGLLTMAPTNKFLLSGFVEKLKGDPTSQFGLVDVYGLLLATRLLVPRGDLCVDDHDLKLSNQRVYLDKGANPLPIYTAVRHEIPLDEKLSDDERAKGGISDVAKEKAKQESWFQWFEFTPYELWCEELNAGIPSWSIGRQFRNGRNVPRKDGLNIPELRIPLLMGIWGSAFCATLSHYYKEIRPLVQGLAGFGDIDQLIEEQNDELIKLHPIVPASIPNFALGLEDQLPTTCPKSIFRSTHLQLMDAGMSNNLPIYPLLRAGRDVDILIIFDASADIKSENWLSVASDYAKQRGIKGWPPGAGWPKKETPKSETSQDLKVTRAASPQEAAGKIADAREDQRKKQEAAAPDASSTDLSYCNIWVGTSPASKPSPTEDTKQLRLSSPSAGLTLIYFPFLPNPKVAGVDPATSDFMSTWNFVYSPEEVDKVVELARANFGEGEERTRGAVRAVWEKKRRGRVRREERDREGVW